ncbi:MAG: UDP-N-acetylmuramoyl-L-alanyl-D-glutamate--2,6-diaminopimelate ligase [Gammaproteobacteria bacterium]
MMVAESMQPTWKLSELLGDLVPVPPNQDRLVYGLAMDSRRVQPGDLFLACAGKQQHGLAFTADAVRAGAVAVVWEPAPGLPAIDNSLVIPALAIASLGDKAGVIASRFFGRPSHDLCVVGVAGTDGKTSCSHFIAQVLGGQDSPCGLLGTLGYGIYGQLEAGTHTTPDAISLQSHLAGFRDQGLRHVVLEVSSHALDQGRISGIEFDVALFTNLGRDHLDYHGDLEAYGRAKRRLFEQSGLNTAVLNTDDTFSQELVTALPNHAGVIAYGLAGIPGWIKSRTESRSVVGQALQIDAAGIRMDINTSWGSGTLKSTLLGEFNARNLLGTLGVVLACGIPLTDALKLMSRIKGVPGRMERFGGKFGQPLVIVDYAHTPQALEHALIALRRLCHGSLWCVFGAGGERDPGKRSLMGACAEKFADRVILTDDNPRREDPQGIVADILSGILEPSAVLIEHDRSAAIRRAVDSADSLDVVLVAGKGHETYQEIGNQLLPFDDRRSVAALFSKGQP